MVNDCIFYIDYLNGLGEKGICIIVLQILLKKLNWKNY